MSLVLLMVLVIFRAFSYISEGRGSVRTIEVLARTSGLIPGQSLIRWPTAGVHQRGYTCPANGTRSRRPRRRVRAKRRSDPSNPRPSSRDR
ncbi:hypothetical protein Pcinc_041452 [Petrolisthes cinctipes]|uniref:Secreted protein n=1 Tax=Petrolisthes cinctipes TaxID=88211 RepID=A0AAE1BJJ1_PETCI|nr:hypothetical protein Pcinc_041452 [Petrolisthes cinctipes]